MNVAGFIFRRLSAAVVVLVGLSIVIFVIARIIPGDAARMALGAVATPEQVEKLRAHLHLDDSIAIQYWHFIKGVAHGDLGESLITRRPVTLDLADTFPATLELVLTAGLIMVLVGVPLGILAARYRDTATDNIARLFALLGVVTPSFVWAVFLMLLFSFVLGILPVAGRLSEAFEPPPVVSGMYTLDALIVGQWGVLWDAIQHLILPAVALALAGMGQAARLTRTNMAEIYNRQYIEMARAFAFREREIALKYALRPAMIPTLTILGLDFAVMLGNAFLVEAVFVWPGMAKFGMFAIMRKDLNAIVGTVLVIGAMFLIVNIIVDLLTAYMNPQIRLGRRTS
jgi:peptide/nickel transport system permease protein